MRMVHQTGSIYYEDIQTDVKLNDRDSVVTLSTCDGNDSTRFIVSAVLVDYMLAPAN